MLPIQNQNAQSPQKYAIYYFLLHISTLAADVNVAITLNLQKVTFQYSSLSETDFTAFMFKISLIVILQK